MRPALRQILFSRPGWVFPGAAIDLDFAHGRYFGGDPSVNISLSRASTGYAQNAAGIWLPFGSNVPRITDQGFLIEEARTNKCTNYNANPPALVAMGTAAAFNAAVTNMTANAGTGSPLFGVVDDTANITAAGFGSVTNGRVYEIDNSAGTGTSNIVISGPTGNTNAHSISIVARKVGAPTINVSTTTGAGSVAVSANSYTRLTSVNLTPGGVNDRIQISVSAGGIAFFILNVLEEGSFVTSPIVTAGTSATRAADIPQLTGAAASAALAAKAAFFQTGGVNINITAPARLFAFDGAGVGVGNMAYTNTTTEQIQSVTTATFGSGTTASTVKSAFGFDASTLTARANAGTLASAGGAWNSGAGVTPYLGNISVGTRALNGYMQRFALSPNKGQFDNNTV